MIPQNKQYSPSKLQWARGGEITYEYNGWSMSYAVGELASPNGRFARLADRREQGPSLLATASPPCLLGLEQLHAYGSIRAAGDA
jgi:hypothetical protein